MKPSTDIAIELTQKQIHDLTLKITQRLTDTLNDLTEEIISPLKISFADNANIATNVCLNLLAIVINTLKDLAIKNNLDCNMEKTYNSIVEQLHILMIDKEVH